MQAENLSLNTYWTLLETCCNGEWLIFEVAYSQSGVFSKHKIRFNILCFYMKLSFLSLASSGFSFLCFPVFENWTAW